MCVTSPPLLPVLVCTIISSLHFQGPFILRNTSGPQVVSPEQKCQPESYLVGCDILCGLGNLQLRGKFHSRGKGQRYLLCFWLATQVAAGRGEGGEWLSAAEIPDESMGHLIPRLEVRRRQGHLQKAEGCGRF